MSLNRAQKSAFIASFLGWALDAFDFFLLVFVVPTVAADMGRPIPDIALTITVTLAMRPVGALLFGYIADKYGRKPALMLDVIFYSVAEFLTGFSRSYTSFITLRALYGVGMGGEWGVGAALTMESVPAESRGFLSGLLQEGYAVGYLLAAVAFFFVFPRLGWRAMFWIGIIPAALVFFVRTRVEESPAWEKSRNAPRGSKPAVNWSEFLPLLGFVVLLMTAFNFMSHGTQDLYPTFLQKQRGFSVHETAIIAMIYSVGGIIGGMFFGGISQKIGRRKAIAIAAILGILAIPLWAFSSSAVLLVAGAFVVQFFVQGAWGIVPAHLNELSPPAVRGTFPGFAYQLGNLLASINAYLQAKIAARLGGNYAIALAAVAAVTMICVAGMSWLGHEAKDARL